MIRRAARRMIKAGHKTTVRARGEMTLETIIERARRKVVIEAVPRVEHWVLESSSFLGAWVPNGLSLMLRTSLKSESEVSLQLTLLPLGNVQRGFQAEFNRSSCLLWRQNMNALY